MKKMLLIMLAGMLLLTGCAQKNEAPKMYVEAAQLTKAENDIAQLLGVGTGYMIYDYVLDETVKQMSVRVYELIDGAWVLYNGGGGTTIKGPKGRIALEFDVLPDGMRVAVQDGSGIVATTHDTIYDPLDVSGMSRSTAKLGDRATVEYGKEIPVAVQIITIRRRSNKKKKPLFRLFGPKAFSVSNCAVIKVEEDLADGVLRHFDKFWVRFSVIRDDQQRLMQRIGPRAVDCVGIGIETGEIMPAGIRAENRPCGD